MGKTFFFLFIVLTIALPLNLDVLANRSRLTFDTVSGVFVLFIKIFSKSSADNSGKSTTGGFFVTPQV